MNDGQVPLAGEATHEGRVFRLDEKSNLYKPVRFVQQGKDTSGAGASQLFRVEVKRDKWVFYITLVVSLATFLVISAYTYLTQRQVAASENANDAARKATRESGRDLGLTLSKMQDQVVQMKSLAGEARIQAYQASKLSTDTHRLAEAANTQAAAARSLTNLTYNQLIRSQRPWLGLEGEPKLRNSGSRWYVDFKVKNYGLSPSLHSVPGPRLLYAPATSDDVGREIDESCDMGEQLTASSAVVKERHGYTVFPGTSTSVISVGMDPGKRSSVTMAGCITYMDRFTDEAKLPIHHTRYCYGAGYPFREGEELRQCFGAQQTD